MTTNEPQGGHWVVCAYIVKNGRVIYPKKSKVFRFWVPDNKNDQK